MPISPWAKFFEMAKKEAYYNNTVFLIIADHSTRLRGQDLIPIDKFHIPGIIIAPHLKPRVFEKIASQIDMTPTLLDIMGISTELPIFGRPLLSLPEHEPGRAIMQYATTRALMVGDRVLVQQPEKPSEQFTYRNERLHPVPLDPEFDRDALAYALVPEYLNSQQPALLPAENHSRQ